MQSQTRKPMSATIPSDPLNKNDRFGIALLLAAAIHGVLILGIAFTYEPGSDAYTPPALDIILVQTQAAQTPKDAERMAQFNQEASGSTDTENAPSSPFSSPDPRPHDGIAPVQMRAASPRKQTIDQTQVLTQKQAPEQINTEQDTDSEQPEKDLTGRQLVERSLEMARLAAEINELDNAYAKRPRVLYLDTISAKSVVEASYIEEWKRKIERIGNLNYPDEAYRKNLTGRLILQVTLNSDGQVMDISLSKSSGHRVLDDAAIRIVQTAAPYSSFPLDMHKTYDRLVITRTWYFKGGRLLTK